MKICKAQPLFELVDQNFNPTWYGIESPLRYGQKFMLAAPLVNVCYDNYQGRIHAQIVKSQNQMVTGFKLCKAQSLSELVDQNFNPKCLVRQRKSSKVWSVATPKR